ncbi:hypothetical protein V8G54_011909 [Vigna mungo]|uniref:NB-ARC domain-containing protein n=1 Tax=Vigna mungo TaxID=3915 RepID=A0AAQ3S2U5_VIGMU
MVHGRLKGKVFGKKFLLVLDDVWNERREEWEAMRTPLSYGASGSRILVTTRVEKVSSNMRSKVHHLKQLEKDECWKFFNKQALKDDDLELNDEKKEIGRRIVEKCKGLPLALKAIGSLLHTKSLILDWQSVLESNIWDLPKEVEIIPALLLSYQHLPSHLKRCFAYCALFPKDYEFDKNELILLWMAKGFLHHSQLNKNVQEIGEQYFDDLLTRSFFLPSSFKMLFVMHDLLNDLPKYVCGDFCFRVKFDKGNCIPKTTRHFAFAFNDVRYFDGFGSLTDAKRLCPFVPIRHIWNHTPSSWTFKISIHDLFSKIKFVRVLSLSCCSRFREVPDSVGDLKHLHSLDLTGSLWLANCKYCLCLPPFGLLSSLKTLTIMGFDGIVSIGAEFYGTGSFSFKSLEILVFSNMKEWECKTTNFPHLKHLSIDRCRKLKGLSDQLLHSEQLTIDSCDELIVSENSMNTSSIENLHIYSCPLVSIPTTHNDFLEVIKIGGGCDSLTIFPLDFFPKLRLLQLRRCQNLRRISQEHTHNHLNELTIIHCPQFESFPNEGLFAPCLEIIAIEGAENLKLLPKHMKIQLQSLKNLRIIDCPQVEMLSDEGLPRNVKYVSLSSLKLMASLRESFDENTWLERLCIEKMDVECFPNEGLLPRSLISLQILNCPNLKKLNYKGLCHLSSLTLTHCHNLQCLPVEGLPKSISSLTIRGCPLLQLRCQNPEGEDWVKIAHIQELIIGEGSSRQPLWPWILSITLNNGLFHEQKRNWMKFKRDEVRMKCFLQHSRRGDIERSVAREPNGLGLSS